MQFTLEYYKKENGAIPFDDWFFSLDTQTGIRIQKYIDKLELGTLGVRKGLKNKISELIIDFGPGYRVYYARVDKTILLILAGGTKRAQQRDIEKAKEYYQEYIMRKGE